MRVIILLFLFAILLVDTDKAIAQDYHKQDSLLYRWLMKLDHDPKLTDEKRQNIEQDSMDKVMISRKITHWDYAESSKVFLLHQQHVEHGVSNNGIPVTLSWTVCDTCPTPHDSAWIVERLKQMEKSKK